MKTYFDQEAACSQEFACLGECYHLWTPENFELIFQSLEDFKTGMNIFGICAKLYPDVRVLTFELMSNHIHITAASSKDLLLEFFCSFQKYLKRHLTSKGRTIDWRKFIPGTRKLESLDDIRNVIVYDNRNGFIVSPDDTPFSYPWGANRYYYNPIAKEISSLGTKYMSTAERRQNIHSHNADSIYNLQVYDGYALPTCFCNIDTGEKLFRNASHYFNKLSRNIESNVTIAKEMGERIFYTDEELFSVIAKKCSELYGNASPSLISRNAKIEMAKMMHYDYGASTKQIQRILKLDTGTIMSMGL